MSTKKSKAPQSQTPIISDVEILKMEVKAWERAHGTKAKLLNLEPIIVCRHSLGIHANILLRDEADNLYLEFLRRTLQDEDGDEVFCLEMPRVNTVPLHAIRQGQLKPVSAKDALAWYGVAHDWMAEWDGDAADLCRIAAKEMEKLTKAA
jgi:hypothetical protein